MSINGSETPRQHEYVDGTGENRNYSDGKPSGKDFKTGFLSKRTLLIAGAIVLALVVLSLIF